MTVPTDRTHEFVPSAHDRNVCTVCGEDVDDPWHDCFDEDPVKKNR